ncbi:SGNH/GDSL hydrolase family protein [Candidatus Woesearchaeota archaeon]|nr:SGNH/GDSL hydrolase family protein [Candidatus Woesearchaeota archaeon]
MPKRFKVINLILLLIAILFCFIILEFVLRLLYPLEYNLNKEYILTNHNVFGRVPNLEYLYKHPEFEQIITLNSKGYRDYEHELNKNDSIFRVAFVGDSFTDAYQVSFNESIPRLIEDKLNQNSNSKYEILNFGMQGFGLVPEVILIEEEVLMYKPNLIILNFFVGNDFVKMDTGVINAIPNNFWTGEHNSLKPKIYKLSFSTRVRSFLNRKFMLYSTAKKLILNNKKDNLSSEGLSDIYLKEYPSQLNENLKKTEDIFKFLKDLTSKNNSSLLIVLVPTKEQIGLTLLDNISLNNYNLEKPQKELINLLEKNDINYVNLLPKLKAENINNTFYWGLDGHFNKLGYRKASEIIYSELTLNL